MDELVEELEVEKRIDKIIDYRIEEKIERLTKEFKQCSNELVDEWEEEAVICSSLAGDNKQAKHKSTWRAASGIKLASNQKKSQMQKYLANETSLKLKCQSEINFLF